MPSLEKRRTVLKQIHQNLVHCYRLSKKRRPLFYLPLILLFFSAIALIFLLKDIPNPQKLTKSPAPVSTQVLDRHGTLLYQVYVDQNRHPVSLSDLPDYIKLATISIEDQNFYHHHGLDLKGMIRAAFKILSGKRLEGGSTITQQLVKIAVLSDSRRTISRKIKEAALALVTELSYSKDQILELYLNHAPYGGTSYGIESAARTYFNKNAKDLNLAEAALLAGLPQSPTKYSPFGANPDLAIKRQHAVLRRLVEDGHVSSEQAQKAKDAPLEFAKNIINIQAPHFSLMVRDLLVDRYGEDRVNLGGLQVTTTLDLNLQEYAQSSLSAQLDKVKKFNIQNGAALITKPKTGEILAMVGSKNYFDSDNDGNVNITTRPRQPGSSIKPINYAVALLRGWTASTLYLDTPTCFNVTGQKIYCPKNYDNSFHGPVQMRFALANSYNIPAVKQLALNGVEAMVATASAMGISTWNDPSRFGLSLTLGGGEVTIWDMATAFGTFANSGVTVPLNPILKVETYTHEILEEHKTDETTDIVSTIPQKWDEFWLNQSQSPEKQLYCPFPLTNLNNSEFSTNQCIRVSLPEEVTYIISHILSDNNARVGAFGSHSQLVIPNKTVSVKTGTTNDFRDNWTIGYTPDFLVATWVGNNDNSPMSQVVSGVTGASTIWNNLTRHLLKDQSDHFPSQPTGIESHSVCNLTGLLATQENQCESRSEIFIKSQLPPPQVSSRKQIWVRRSDKYPLLSGDQTIDLDLEEHTVVTDPFTRDYCLDCPYPANDKNQISWPKTTINYDTFRLHPPNPRTFSVSPPSPPTP